MFVTKFLILDFLVMYRFMCLIFIHFSTQSFGKDLVFGYYQYDNLSTQENRLSSHRLQQIPLASCTLNSSLLKCCPSNKIFSSIQHQCVSAPKKLLSTLATIWSINFPHFKILSNFSCNYPTYILNKSRGQDYQLRENGILHEPFHNLNHNFSEFCFEYILEDAIFMPTICTNKKFAHNENWRYMFYTCGMFVSNFFLLFTLSLYLVTPALRRNVQDKSFSCYIITLVSAFCSLTVAHNYTKASVFCTFIAYMTHFWLLAQFFWLNIMCIDIWQAVNTTKLTIHSSGRKFTLYCWYAWGCPLLLSVATFLADKFLTVSYWRPGLGEDDCWFRRYSGHYWLDPKFMYFYSIISLTLLVNFGLFINSAFIIASRNQEWKQKHPDSRRHKQNQKRFLLHLKLFMVMGLNWIMDVVSYYSRGVTGIWFIIDMINYLQGVIIFIIFICNKKVIHLLKKRFFPKRTFSKEYGRFASSRNLNKNCRRSPLSSTTSRPSSSEIEIDSNTAKGSPDFGNTSQKIKN